MTSYDLYPYLAPFFLFPSTIATLLLYILFLNRRVCKHDKSKRLCLIDQLTQTGSRTAYEEAFKNLRRKADFPIALLICDMDGLKKINDSLGHENGDRQLQRFSTILRGCVRSGDAVFRLGGDEFAILLPGMDAESIDRLIERITLALKEASLVQPDRPALAASIGAALAQNSDELASLHNRADEAMYAQKRAKIKPEEAGPAAPPST